MQEESLSRPIYLPQRSTPTAVRRFLVLLLGGAFTVALNFWVLHAELGGGAANIAGGNPPVPVLLALTVLLPLHRFLKLTDTELTLFYLFAVFAFLPATLGGVRAFFPCLTTPFYFATPDNQLKEFWQFLPDWWAPKETLALRGFFEGADGRVPWSVWLPLLLYWSVFFVAIWMVGWGIAWWLAPQWLAQERLNFPLAQLPRHMIEGIDERSFFTSRLVRVGAVVGTLPTMLMVLCSAFRPVERYWDLGIYLSERPFNTLRPLLIYPLLEGIGFGYLVPQDVLLSVWFSYGMLKAFSFVGSGFLGWEVPDFPFPSAQSFGGYLAVAAMLSVRRLRHRTKFSSALILWGIGGLVMVLWMVLSGMGLPLAFLYAVVLFGITVTYTRVRAELGMPYTNVYPYGAQAAFWNISGMPVLLQLGGKRGVIILVSLFWLLRRFLLFQYGAYGADAVKLVGEKALSARSVSGLTLIAAVIGTWAAFVSHLLAYYRWGALFLEGASGGGDYRTYEAARDYRHLSWKLNTMPSANRWELGFALYGAISVAILAFLRRTVPNFPLHPLGFVMGTSYGHHCPYWFPTLLIWVVKGIILRYGGMRGHRRLVPFFLGLTLGHYLMTGVIWAGILFPLVKDRWAHPFRILFQ